MFLAPSPLKGRTPQRFVDEREKEIKEGGSERGKLLGEGKGLPPQITVFNVGVEPLNPVRGMSVIFNQQSAAVGRTEHGRLR